MTAMLLALSLLAPIPAPEDLPLPPLSGTWSQYGLSPSQGQIWYHSTVTGKLRNPERYDGFIAVLDCDLVGEDAWIQVHPLKRWQHVQVLDCSGHQSTTEWFNRAGIIGELFYNLARKNGVPIGRGVSGAITFTEPQEVRDVPGNSVVSVGRGAGGDAGRVHVHEE